VHSRGGDANRPLGRLLPADVGKVDVVGSKPIEPFGHPRRRRGNHEVAGEELDRLGQRTHRNDLDVFDHGGLGSAGGRHDDSLERPVPSLMGGGHGN